MKKTKTSIIISVDNSYELLNNFFEHLFNTINEKQYEIVTVSDGCKNLSSIEYLRKLQKKHVNFRLVETEKKGYSAANNLGVYMSNGDTLLFMNSDIFPKNKSIEKLIQYLHSDQMIGCVQGLLLYPQTHTVQSTGHVFGDYFNRHAFEGRNMNDPIIQQIQQRQGLTSAFYAMSKETFVYHGGFNEFFYNAWDGLDLSIKIGKGNLKCMYYPEAVAYHARGGSRDFMQNNEEQQTAFFWSKWGNIITNDLITLLQKQINEVNVTIEYQVINCSHIRTWKEMLSQLNINFRDILHIRDRFSNKINLYYNLTYNQMTTLKPLLFLTNSTNDLKGNKEWIQKRPHNKDIVMDLHGNIISLKEL